MPIIKKTEGIPPRPVIILIYGEPGLGKTSLFNTCKKPLLLDFDRGVERSHGRQDTLVIKNGYQEVLEEEANGSFNGYETVGIDNPKALLDDFLMVYVQKLDGALLKNKLRAFGAIGDEFKLFINKRRDAGVDIVIVAHATSDKEGDNTKYYPDVTGQSLQVLKRIADQIGYMHMDSNQNRVVDFRPSSTIVGKDTAGIGVMLVPKITDPNFVGFCDREIVQKVKDALSKMTDDQRAAIETIDSYQSKIDAIEGSDEALKLINTEIAALPEKHIVVQLREYLKGHLQKIGWKWDGTLKVFVKVEAPAAPVVPTNNHQPDQPPVEPATPVEPPVVVPPVEPATPPAPEPPAAPKAASLIPDATTPRIDATVQDGDLFKASH